MMLDMIEIAAISESGLNPRTQFGDMEDLTKSVLMHGVMEPIMVRPSKAKGKYELVFGARRLRAASNAGLSEIPATVMPKLTKKLALQMILIENMEREDLHPLDEAEGLSGLLGLKMSVEEIASKLSRSTKYVYERLKLLTLTDPVKAAFFAGSLSFGHAKRIARYGEDDQAVLLEWVIAHEPSLRRLDEFLAGEFERELSSVPWKLDDAMLDAVAGACSGCPKRSSAQADLFDETPVSDRCLDAVCFDGKHKFWYEYCEAENPDLVDISMHDGKGLTPLKEYQLVSAVNQDVPPELVNAGIYVDGLTRGQVVDITTDSKYLDHEDPEDASDVDRARRLFAFGLDMAKNPVDILGQGQAALETLVLHGIKSLKPEVRDELESVVTTLKVADMNHVELQAALVGIGLFSWTAASDVFPKLEAAYEVRL